MIVVTVSGVQAEEVPTPAGRPEAVAAWLRVPAFVERGRSVVASSPWLDRTSAVPTWIGVAVVGLGFAVLAYGWGRIGGLASVALQLPYAISAGCGGLGLIVTGAAIVGIQAKRREAAAREEIVLQLRHVVGELERLTAER
jgi:hypothetical protein